MALMKTCAYVRYSSDNQRDESIDAQIRAIEDFAKKNNYSVVKIYTDKAKTATSDKRPEFQQMIADCEKGLYDVLIVHKLDRFARDKYDSTHYKRRLKTCGVKLVSVLENLDDSPEAIILESVLEGMAEYYSKNLAREVMKGMRETAHQCKHTGGKAPLGYDVDPVTKQYVINEVEATAVKLIYVRYLDGYGYVPIMEELKSKGLKTKCGNDFGKNSINNVLVNEKYYGVYIFNKVVGKDARGKRTNRLKAEDEIIKIPGGMPAIITEEMFKQVQKKMRRNRTTYASYQAVEPYLLSGLIYCGVCGCSMVGNRKFSGRSKLKYVTYRCNNRDRKKGCRNKEIRREYVEKHVIEYLYSELFNESEILQLVSELNESLSANEDADQQELIIISEQLKEVNKNIKNIVDAVAKGFTHESFLTKMEELEINKATLELRAKEIQVKEKRTAITEDVLRGLLSKFKTFVDDNNITEIKKFITTNVEKVVVYAEHVDVVFGLTVCTEYGGEPWLGKSTIRRRVMLRMFGEVA